MSAHDPNPGHLPVLSPDEEDRQMVRAVVRQAKIRRAKAFAYPTCLAIAVLLLWQFGTTLFKIPPYLLPGPGAVIEALAQNWQTILKEALTTSEEVVWGYALSIAVGIPLALAIFLWRPVSDAVYPLLVASQAMPKVAIAPLFVVWFGFGFLPKILIAFLIAFFPIVLNTVTGLTAIEPEKIALARSMGLGVWRTFVKIRLPNAMPSIFGGLKIAVTLAVVGAIVGEFVGGNGGLGYQLMSANGSMDTPLLFAVLLTLTLLGALFYMAVEVIERVVAPKHHAAIRQAQQSS